MANCPFMLEFKGHVDAGGVTWFIKSPQVEGRGYTCYTNYEAGGKPREENIKEAECRNA